jgi:hypothetical protein
MSCSPLLAAPRWRHARSCHNDQAGEFGALSVKRPDNLDFPGASAAQLKIFSPSMTVRDAYGAQIKPMHRIAPS